MAHCIYNQAEKILSGLEKCPVYLRRMEYTMLSLKAVLKDAEEKQEQCHLLCNWLKELQIVFSQIEGSIDEFKGEVDGKQVLAPPFLCSNRNVCTKKKKKLCDHLDAIAAKMYEFNLTEKHTTSIRMETTTHSFLSATEVSTRLMKPSWQLIYPLTNAPKVYRDHRYDDFLNDFKHSTHGFFHIVGDEGIGKSTLAKFIYNDSEVSDEFSSRMWVCVKEEFDTQRLIKEILSFSCRPKTYDNLTEKQLRLSVQQYLRERTFLLVFQDLSIKNLDNCSMFTSLLGMRNPGSKIIVTTQNEEIADAIGLGKVYKAEKQSEVSVTDATERGPSNNNNHNKSIQDNPLDEQEASIVTHQTIYKVERLSRENSSTLFKDYAFRDTQEDQISDLPRIEEVLEKKCKGVPLAIKCLGGLLSSKTNIAERNDVINMLSTQEEEVGNILPTLRLCYELMPSHLQHCFLYCSQLPNDHILSSNDVIQLWMAHGLLNSAKQNYLSLENIGENYFKELCSRCFLQEIEEYGLGYWFKMHPLIRKLAHIVAEEQAKPVTEIRSIAFQVRDRVPPSAFLVNKCIANFNCLRLLYLGNANLQEIPNAIGTMKNLRYLDLQGNKRIKRLPNSICNLQSLQTLILASCSALEELPKDIRKLIKLRYLWVTANKLHLHKNGVGTMTSLRLLAIGGCDNLQDLFEKPSCLVGLETLMIYDCKTLKLLPKEMGFLISLQNLVIWSCKQLSRLTLTGVEFRLRRFTMRELPKVIELPEWLQRSKETLKLLEIIDCPIKIEDDRIRTYRAIERICIHGDVRVKALTGEYGVEFKNLVRRLPWVGATRYPIIEKIPEMILPPIHYVNFEKL